VVNQVTQDSGATPATLTYDANGNRNMTGYATGAANRMTNDGTYTYTYDAEGNRLTRSAGSGATLDLTTYTYDNQNHLIGVWQTLGGVNQVVVTYTYDVLGRRVQQDEWTIQSGTTTTTKFAYDGQQVWADLTAGNVVQTRYVYGDVTDQVLARTDTTLGLSFYLTDHLGSVRGLTDSSGVIQDAIDYTAFGAVNFETSATYGGHIKYTGREYDPNTGLQFNRRRYYDVANGRFISEDPKRFGAGDADLSRYVGNEATAATDPTGLDKAWYEVIFSTDTLWFLIGERPDGNGGHEEINGGVRERWGKDMLRDLELALPQTRMAALAGAGYDATHQGLGNLTDLRRGDPLRGFDWDQNENAMILSGPLGPLAKWRPKTVGFGLAGLGGLRGGSEILNGDVEQGIFDLSTGALLAKQARRPRGLGLGSDPLGLPRTPDGRFPLCGPKEQALLNAELSDRQPPPMVLPRAADGRFPLRMVQEPLPLPIVPARAQTSAPGPIVPAYAQTSAPGPSRAALLANLRNSGGASVQVVNPDLASAGKPGQYTTTIKWGIHQVQARQEGSGFWGKRIPQDDPRVNAYELKINPRNESYYLPHPEGGYVQFENLVGKTVQDGKLILKPQSSLYGKASEQPGVPFARKVVLQEANRQTAAAAKTGMEVEWLVSDRATATQLQNLFNTEGIKIKVTHLPE
jgi:RHS repeat-associated protein